MKRHIIIPDTQLAPGDNLEFIDHIGKYIAHMTPDVIVQIGDWADMSSLSSWDIGKKSYEGRQYVKDIQVANEGLHRLMHPINRERFRRLINKKKRWNPRMVFTEGNHENRINRAVDSDRKLEGLISTQDIRFEEHGFERYEFLKPVVIDGVVYVHYLTSGVMGRPITTAQGILTKRHQSAVVGHQQGRQVSTAVRADGKLITAIIAGSCYEKDEAYLGEQGNNHFRGIVVLNEVEDGSFDEMFVSLSYLRKRYG